MTGSEMRRQASKPLCQDMLAKRRFVSEWSFTRPPSKAQSCRDTSTFVVGKPSMKPTSLPEISSCRATA